MDFHEDPAYPTGLVGVFERFKIRPHVWSDCPPGWLPLVDATFTALVAMGWKPSVGQVKEKFGGLRLYLNGLDVDVERRPERPFWEGYFDASRHGPMHTLVAMAEAHSYRTCMVCGRWGRPNKTGWIFTLCTRHRRAYNKGRRPKLADVYQIPVTE